MKSTLFFLFFCFLLCFAQGQRQSDQETITVTGTGMIEVPTTEANIRFSIQSTKSTATEATQVTAGAANRVVARLQADPNVTRLRTLSVFLYPTYSSYPNGTLFLQGYVSTHTLSFRTPIRSAGELLDLVVGEGATQIENVETVANDTSLREARFQAVKASAHDALDVATAWASSLSPRNNTMVVCRPVVPPKTSSVSSSLPSPSPTPYSSSDVTAERAAPTPVLPGTTTVFASTTATFVIRCTR